MKCPICGEQLRPGKKDPNYLLCYTCKKKFKVPAKKSQEQKYSNIPPKRVRDEREREMRRAYDDMLAIEDEKVSKAPVIILGIAIVVVAALIAYMLFFK